MDLDINTLDDVRTFARLLLKEGINVHPDDDFNDYINMNTGNEVFTPEEASLRNSLMAQSFRICQEVGADLYDEIQEVYLLETGLSKFIPLPSQSQIDGK